MICSKGSLPPNPSLMQQTAPMVTHVLFETVVQVKDYGSKLYLPIIYALGMTLLIHIIVA